MNLGKLYLTQSDKCVQVAQYKLLGTIGLNLGHVASKLGHTPVAADKEVACVLEVTEAAETVSEVVEDGVVKARGVAVGEAAVVVVVVEVVMAVVAVVVVAMVVVVVVAMVVVVVVVATVEAAGGLRKAGGTTLTDEADRGDHSGPIQWRPLTCALLLGARDLMKLRINLKLSSQSVPTLNRARHPR